MGGRWVVGAEARVVCASCVQREGERRGGGEEGRGEGTTTWVEHLVQEHHRRVLRVPQRGPLQPLRLAVVKHRLYSGTVWSGAVV